MPTVPPVTQQTVPPMVPQMVPPVTPQMVPRMVPPVTHQTVPPMVPPLTPRTVPPRVPPVTQQTVPPIVPPTVAAAREAEVQQMIQTFTDNLQIASNSDRDTGALDTTSAAQIIKPTSMSLQVCPCGWSKVTTNKGLRIHQGKKECKRRGDRIPNNSQLKAPQVTDSTSPIQVAEKPEGEQNIRKNLGRKSLQRESSPKNSTPIKAEPLQTSTTPILGNQANPSITKVKVEETNQTLFQTPTQALGSDTRAHRALDFSTGAKQVEKWSNATNTAQELSKKERDEQKLAKTKQDKIRADLQMRIQMMEQKMAEIKSSEKACKGSLDAEWVEINDVFSAVKRVVDEARLKALKPLEERRKRVKRETQDLVQKLQKEIDKLKKTIDELDQNKDPGVSHLLEPQSWERETVDTSFSFSTLRATTSKMIQEIQEKVEKLSSTELKRTSKFAGKIKALLLTAIIIIFILALAHEDKKVPSNIELSQMRTNTKAYEAFTEQHIISESFDRNSLQEWASYLEGKYLCGRTPTQSFIDASAADVKKICSSSGWLVEDAPVLQSDFCMSGSTMTVYQVESDTCCNVLSAIRSDHYVTVRCANLGGLYLPIHYEAYRNQRPAQKHCTPPWIDQSIKTDL
ncbi:protein split ends-like [Notolabrus celidotus]|uniref:protein split ends-like n=1 Tax=Notolabrus celidotus TaxID=1203425 RepID=UPI00148F4ADF|nr:protein split ends-like [Notolabrus celidotus]